MEADSDQLLLGRRDFFRLLGRSAAVVLVPEVLSGCGGGGNGTGQPQPSATPPFWVGGGIVEATGVSNLTFTPDITPASGDIVILFASANTSDNPAGAPPSGFRYGVGGGSGFDLVGNAANINSQLWAWCWKIAGASEPTSYTWVGIDQYGSSNMSGGIAIYRGADNASPFDVAPTLNTRTTPQGAGTASIVASGVAAGTANRLLVMLFGSQAGASVTNVAPTSGSPSIWTLRESATGSGSGGAANAGIADCVDSAGTFTSNVTATQTTSTSVTACAAFLIALKPATTPVTSNTTQVELAHFGTDANNGITLNTEYDMFNSASVNDVVVIFFTYNGGNGNPATPVLPTFTAGGATYSAAFANQTFIYDANNDTTTASYVAIVTGAGTPWIKVSSLGGGNSGACFIQMYTLRGLYVAGGISGLVNAAVANNSNLNPSLAQAQITAQSTVIVESACWPTDVFGAGGTFTNGIPKTTNGIYQSFPISQGYMASGWLGGFLPGYYSIGTNQSSIYYNGQNMTWLALTEK